MADPTPAPLDLEAVADRHLRRLVSSIRTKEQYDDCSDDCDGLLDECRRLRAERDELGAALDQAEGELDAARADLAACRAVLAPLLSKPFISTLMMGARLEDRCAWCHCRPHRDTPEPHARDCPVLRRDALLGRTGAGVGEEAPG